MDELTPELRAIRDEYFAVLRTFVVAARAGAGNLVDDMIRADRLRSRTDVLRCWNTLLGYSTAGVTSEAVEAYCGRLSELYKQHHPAIVRMPSFSDDEDDLTVDARLYGAVFPSVKFGPEVELANLELPYLIALGATHIPGMHVQGSTIHLGFKVSATSASIGQLTFLECQIGGQGLALGRAGAIAELAVVRCRVSDVLAGSHNNDLRPMDGVVVANSQVGGEVRLQKVKAIQLDFEGSTFADRVDLSKSEISALRLDADFRYCPELYDTTLPGRAHLLEMHLDGRAVGRRRTGVDPTRQRAEYAAVRCARILCQSRRWTREESLFFAEEQRLERRLSKFGFERSVSWLYDIASAYGSSVTRAGAALVVFNVGFGLLYWLLQQVYGLQLPSGVPGYSLGIAPNDISVDAGGDQLKGFKSSLLALQNMVNPLGSFSAKALVSVQSPTGLVLSALQVVGSLSLLAIFLLALRGRFQKSGSGSTAS